MTTILLSLILFSFGYVVNMFYISVLYHRALTHKSIILGPKMMSWLGLTGGFFTGLDPKTWACMHRLHHIHADTDLDPHSPSHLGVMGVWMGQYKSYLRIQKSLLQKEPELISIVADIPFQVSFTNRHNLSWLPYLVHAGVGVLIATGLDSFWCGLAYFLGIMSHPVQGWMVNALAHKYGHRNFETSDDSTNNLWVGLFAFGEGYQNNHHKYPERARFSVRSFEIDPGYGLCLIAERLGFLKIVRS